MDKLIDLHFHSVYSEGQYTPEELLIMAQQHQMAVLALTDHNVIAGNSEMQRLAPQYGIQVFPGVELYTQHGDYLLHLLGYNFDPEDKVLNSVIQRLQADNEKNVGHSISALEKQGFSFDRDKIENLPARNYGAVHLLHELEQHPDNIKKIHSDLANKHQDFFAKIQCYFGSRSEAHLPLSTIPTTEAITLIKAAGGFSSLAHPGQQLSFEQDEIIVELAAAGLDALEVLSPYHNWHEIEHYQWLMLRHGLLMTGGSDFHGPIDFSKKEIIAKQWDYLRVPYSVFDQLKNNIPNL